MPRIKKLFTDETDLDRLRELFRIYKDGFALDIELTGRSEVWLEGFFYAFERVDELCGEYIDDVID